MQPNQQSHLQCKAHRRNSALNGRRPIEALLARFQEDDIFHRLLTNDSGGLRCLFFAPKTGISVATDFSKNAVFIMDSTHKTNKYKIHCCTSLELRQQIRQYRWRLFSFEKKGADYAWALQQFQSCFRSLLNENELAVVVDRELALIAGITSIFPMLPY